MENIKDLLENNKFIRVDKNGQHVEDLNEYTSQDINEVLKGLNRHPKDLLALFNKTQNQKFLNDIGLAYVAEHYYMKSLENKVPEVDVTAYEQKIKNQDAAYEELRKKYAELNAQNNTLKDKIEECAEHIEDIEADYDKLNGKHQIAVEEIEKYEKHVDYLANERDAYKADCLKLEDDNKKLLSDLAKHEEDNKKLLSDLAKCEEDNKKLQEQIQTSQESEDIYKKFTESIVNIVNDSGLIKNKPKNNVLNVGLGKFAAQNITM